MTDYQLLIAGAVSTVLGTLVGAWIGARLTYVFQRKLLEQQLDFQKRQSEEDAKLRKEMSESLNRQLESLRPPPPAQKVTRPNS